MSQKEENAPLPETSEIQRLDQDTVRRITAEQAISNLSSIVKELMDNALDAESTTIKIRLFGQGLDIIEVSDDGNGVPKGSLPYMATRHATSKIEQIEDIYTGTGMTMGFRGEALFAMACVSDSLVVASRTEDDELATKVLFGTDGQPTSNGEMLPRKVGTTVAVVKPFGNLPARRADLVRRIKQERTKIFKLVEAYGIFNVGVGFRLIDINNNREDVGLATSSSSQSLKETTSMLLGPSFLKSTKWFEISLESFFREKQKSHDESENELGVCHNWGVKGLISVEKSVVDAQKHRRGAGRVRTVQYYSINGRVVDLPKVSALLKKLWTSLDGKKKPSALFEFTMPNNAFDINLSPDKTKVLFTHEVELLALLEEKIMNLWSDVSSNAFVAGESTQSQREDDGTTALTHHEIPMKETKREIGHVVEDHYEYKRRFAFVHDIRNAKMQHEMDRRQKSVKESSALVPLQSETPQIPLKQVKLAAIIKPSTKSALEKFPEDSHETIDVSQTEVVKSSKGAFDSVGNQGTQARSPSQNVSTDSANSSAEKQKRFSRQVEDNPVARISDMDRTKWNEIQSKFHRSEFIRDDSQGDQYEAADGAEESALTSNRNATKASISEETTLAAHRVSSTSASSTPSTSSRVCLEQFSHTANASVHTDEAIMRHPPKRQRTEENRKSPLEPECTEDTGKGYGSTPFPASPPKSQQSLNNEDSNDKNTDEQVIWKSFSSTKDVCLNARFERMEMRKRKKDINEIRKDLRRLRNQDEAEGTSPATKDNNCEEDRSQLVRLSKSIFRSGMTVIGQFNLGFILAKCSQNHLWILDQHACDEKHNFEELCRNTKIHEQPLIHPLPIELTPSEEACVLDYMDVFEANGFKFRYDEDAPIRHRLSLTSLPHSGAHEGRKAVQFGPSDVSALCAVLSEGSSYDAGSGGTGTDGNGLYGNNAVRRHASINRTNDADRLLTRLPKAIAMFASRACRTSIMIGTALSQTEMATIVQKLARVDMPWNCPHGRPTMRHVANVLPLLLKDERRAMEYIAVPTITVVPTAQTAEGTN